MSSALVRKQAESFLQARPDIRPGFTVRVHEKIKEGDKERIQIFEGLVIAVHNGHAPTDRTITVRKIVSGVGVEKLFTVHSPRIEKIEVKKVAKVRRAKLFFLRGLQGKAARLQERFTTAGEFAAEEVAAPVEEDVVEDVAAEEEVAQKEASAEVAPAETAEATVEEEKKDA